MAVVAEEMAATTTLEAVVAGAEQVTIMAATAMAVLVFRGKVGPGEMRQQIIPHNEEAPVVVEPVILITILVVWVRREEMVVLDTLMVEVHHIVLTHVPVVVAVVVGQIQEELLH